VSTSAASCLVKQHAEPLRLPTPGVQWKPAGQVPQSLRGQEFVVERHPVEHLIEQSRIAPGDPDGEENEGLGIDRPSIGSFDGR
jgi:hypothetical protein